MASTTAPVAATVAIGKRPAVARDQRQDRRQQRRDAVAEQNQIEERAADADGR